jgi:uncharacterized protein YdeI (BOF family)
MASPQANGYYPRLNAAMVSSGKFNGNIVSLMGRFVSGATDGNHVSFQCSDGGTLSLSVEHADFPNMDVMDGPVVEVVGQVMKENEVAVRCNILYGIQLSHVLLLRCDAFDDCGSYCILIHRYLLPTLHGFLQLFVTRELSKDTDLQVYDKMIAMQHNPKFAQYFAPIDGNVAGSGMVTN